MTEEVRPLPARVGVIVIGRNEGERFRRCLRSLGNDLGTVVYVDSGSHDDSPQFAHDAGATVVDLDTSLPFTAARARNEGFSALERAGMDVDWVQFVDGDCEIEAGWMERAIEHLRERADLAAVFGRRRERAPHASHYNRLCDLEWDVPVGSVQSCGGDVMMRASAFRESGGYSARLIAGEEPELCYRLRKVGWRIERIDAPMTIHDADMHHFSQWWRRAMRAGYVEAEGVADLGVRYPRLRSALSNAVWALVLPLVATVGAAAALAAGRPALALACVGSLPLIYSLLWLRIYRYGCRRWPDAAGLHATFCLLGKWPAVCGMLLYWWRRMRAKGSRLIEYKGSTPSHERQGSHPTTTQHEHRQ